jgi:hypothetical protein
MTMAPSVPACTERATAGAGVWSEDELTVTIVAQNAGHRIRNNPQASAPSASRRAGAQVNVRDVPVAPPSIERFSEVLDAEAFGAWVDLAERARSVLRGRVVWCVSSTANGGGVAEMLRSLLAYTRGAGVDSRWGVIEGEPEFFALTKRLHNCLHAAPNAVPPTGADRDAGAPGPSCATTALPGASIAPPRSGRRAACRMAPRSSRRCPAGTG